LILEFYGGEGEGEIEELLFLWTLSSK